MSDLHADRFDRGMSRLGILVLNPIPRPDPGVLPQAPYYSWETCAVCGDTTPGNRTLRCGWCAGTGRLVYARACDACTALSDGPQRDDRGPVSVALLAYAGMARRPRAAHAWAGVDDGGYRVRYGNEQELTALDGVFHLLDGKGIMRENKGPLFKAINETNQSGQGETEYFRFKCFKNRNLHIEFKRLDLVKDLNGLAAGERVLGSDD